jgi:uncharacterized protein (DUF2236 family)
MMSLITGNSRRDPVAPYQDHGFFGPGSVTWRVWGHPTSFAVGFIRSVVIEELDPFLVAAVDQSEKVYTQPKVRYDRTLAYFATVAFGDSRTAIEASETLVKVHSMAKGVEPISGKVYDANDPDQQLWIHMTAWHSILLAYERYGPGKLSEGDELEYWRQCAVAAELQTIDAEKVPRTRDGVRAYFESVRPRLASSEAAQKMMNHLLAGGELVFPEKLERIPGARWITNRFLRAAVLATIPRWMRELGNCRQPALVDAAIAPMAKFAHAVLARAPKRLQLTFVGLLSPRTRPVIEPIWRGIPPRNDEVLTPGEARERYGAMRPAEIYESIRERADSRNPRLAAAG